MSGTYTPSQTWHSTATYVQTGETITETVSKDLGASAMDNIASLVGTAAGATPQAVRRIATVADLTALKAIGTADRADEDYVILSDTRTIYRFASGGAGTADDYNIVTPTAGTGRWFRVSSVPRSTVLRRVLFAVDMELVDTAGSVGKVDASGRVTCDGGGTVTLRGRLTGFNAGDLITEIQLVADANVGGGGANVVAVFYAYQADDGDTTPTIVTLGTLTRSAGSGAGEESSTAAPLPFTIPDGAEHDEIHVVITCSTGAFTSSYIYWVAANGSRSFINE